MSFWGGKRRARAKTPRDMTEALTLRAFRQVLSVVLHELAEGAFVFVGHAGELHAEAHVADVVEDFALNLPPLVVGQRDAYVDGLAEEGLDGVGREQAAARAEARDLAVVLILLRRPPLDRERGRNP